MNWSVLLIILLRTEHNQLLLNYPALRPTPFGGTSSRPSPAPSSSPSSPSPGPCTATAGPASWPRPPLASCFSTPSSLTRSCVSSCMPFLCSTSWLHPDMLTCKISRSVYHSDIASSYSIFILIIHHSSGYNIIDSSYSIFILIILSSYSIFILIIHHSSKLCITVAVTITLFITIAATILKKHNSNFQSFLPAHPQLDQPPQAPPLSPARCCLQPPPQLRSSPLLPPRLTAQLPRGTRPLPPAQTGRLRGRGKPG